ncbi:hypothetical protein F4V43_16185 [Paenibacillus spiritus]|uniref:STAS domain-containing protein n=1 Tax=Paenibacillus spiritus TaxID=2496557 RepID=A0A5J5FYD4_9BACL|nr:MULTISPECIES: hypothetical protein [Paenibacillus]KAA8998768.1 hypothetical protein F4V43_16185 [Paenibacillus spiritus]
MGTFNLNTDKNASTLNVKVGGTFSTEDAELFIADYNRAIGAFDPKQYEIILDCTELNVSSPDVLPMLEQCFILYKNSGFKNVVFTIKRNPILKMQLSRVARTTQLQHYEIREV